MGRNVVGMWLAVSGLCALMLAGLCRRCCDPQTETGTLPPPSAAHAADTTVRLLADPTSLSKRPSPASADERRRVPATPSTPGDVDVCGYGTVKLAAHDALGLDSLPEETRRAALAGAHEQLLSSDDEAVRAAGLLIAGQVDRLAQLAAASSDPVIYAIAIQGCGQNPAGEATACALLTRAQWARLDPDNALPWLEVAASAREQGDTGTEAEAMWRAAYASRLDAVAGKLSSLVDKGLDRLPSLQHTLALAAIWRIQSAWPSSSAHQADRYCSTETLTEGNRWLLCEKLAQGLVMHASRIDDFAVGVALAGRMDWPAARLLALRQEEDALAEAAQLQTMVTDMSCESVERLQGWRRVVGADGELQAARIILARSGRSTAWWSEQHRKSFDLAVATVAEIAASAARSTR